MYLRSEHILRLLARCVNIVWCVARPVVSVSPAQAFEPMTASVPEEKLEKLAPAGCFHRWEPSVLQCGLFIFFSLTAMHPRRWRGLGEDQSRFAICQGFSPVNLRPFWHFGVRSGV